MAQDVLAVGDEALLLVIVRAQAVQVHGHVDTFSELRGNYAATKHTMENTCFICGVDRFTLDTKGCGFDRHTAHDHNMWMYLFMLCSIWNKDEDDYNGWEQWVADQLKANKVEFLPRNSAIVLRSLMDAAEAESRSMRESIMHMRGEVDKLVSVADASVKKGSREPMTAEALNLTEVWTIQSEELRGEMSEIKSMLRSEMADKSMLRGELRELKSMLHSLASNEEHRLAPPMMPPPQKPKPNIKVTETTGRAMSTEAKASSTLFL